MTERLYRSNSGNLVGGVCAGLADYFSVHPVLLRLAFLLWILASTTGAIVYVALWVILPEERTLGHSLDDCMRRNVEDMQALAERWYHDVESALGASKTLDANQVRRVVTAGGVVAGLGLVLLIDSLHLLDPFRLRQLEPLALILLGIVMIRRTL
jgi:phage shock protein C